MNTYTIRFKIIDHESDLCAYEECTIVEADTRKQALDQFYASCGSLCVDLVSITEKIGTSK